MDIFDFLENNEKKQIQLIKLLLEKGKLGCSMNQLRSSLNMSPKSLNTLCEKTEKLLQEYDANAKIVVKEFYSNKRIILLPSISLDFSKIYRRYLKESKYFQILILLLEHGKCKIGELTEELYMSEASLFRHLKNLNLLLKEFSVQIKNGTIVGSETQIRYLHYNLIINAYSYDELQSYANLYPIKTFMALFDGKQNLRISAIGKIRLSIWLEISLNRFLFGERSEILFDRSEIKRLKDNLLYHELKNWIFGVLSQYAVQFDEFEVYNIYIFMCSMEIVDLENEDLTAVNTYLSLTVKEINEANAIFIQHIGRYYPRVEKSISNKNYIRIKYVITQLHQKICYFYGAFYLFSGDSITRITNDDIYTRIRRLSIEQVVATLKCLNIDVTESQREIMSRKYFDLIVQIHDDNINKLQIGVRLFEDWSIVSGIISRMRAMLEQQYNMKLEYAYENKKYDLILTNSYLSLKRMNYNKYYILPNMDTTYDLENIKALLDEIYEERFK
ncbi:Mga helix-turn-helix domain [Enterococcus durans]|uniref:Mga helix-turn-helix domain n=2 Tax=Enterococcus durans TaxID=53345 RepID=A0A377KIG8_9ENTE|nr:helix-turn-helix domain-containing protein [Enterococcus durans]STP28224.1 Mga helix-turn-helix domain [Enterococcus durans]